MANENDGNLRNNNNEIDENLLQSINKEENLTKTSTSNNKGDYRNIRATSGDVSHVVEQQPRREENPFSFKHFLNRDTNSSTTIIGSATISNSSSNIYINNSNKNNSITSKLLTTTLQNSSTQQQHNIPVTIAATTIVTGFTNSSNNYTILNNNNFCNELNQQSTNTTQINTGIINTSTNISNNLLAGTITTNNYGILTTTTTTTATAAISYQTSTGARPKVPQSTSISSSIGGVGGQYPSTSVSTTSMSSLVNNSETSKMKRSPRFSSFDSQASLAEYAGGNTNNCNSDCSVITNSYNIDKILKDAGQILDDPGSKLCSNNIQKTTQQQQLSAAAATTTTTTNTTNNGIQLLDNNYDKMYVPRSYSNYDMDLPIRNSNSFNGRGGNNSIDNNSSSPIMRRTSPARPNRLSGILSQQQQSQPTNMNHHSSTGNNTGNIVSGGLHCRPNSEFAAALPDFVQDHWMDHPWYFNEMHLNSPPNSPNRQQTSSPLNFVCDHLPAGMANPPGLNCSNNNVSGGNNEKCQTLPDFLSDGPIIHSSGRLADVAVGLPNLDSPEDNSPTLQLSRIRLENERLRRELDESRIALAEQTRRSGDLERLLEQARSNESAFNRTLAQNIGQVEENLDQSKKRTAAAQNLVSKLKQQVKQLTAEVEVLKRDNESLREGGGAVGGTDRTTENISRRPSRTQQLSRDLIKAASTAENNLRQLLLGVENLRLMAASIENLDDCIDYNPNNPTNSTADTVTPSGNENISSVNLINDDFLSDCDGDFDDFSGPAL